MTLPRVVVTGIGLTTALGATRFRIIQQNFVESLLLALGAGVWLLWHSRRP